MNIHEYQAKQLFERFGIPTPQGITLSHPFSDQDLSTELREALEKFPQAELVVKAQIHAGGRGKGTFLDGFQGGVHLVSNRQEALKVAKKMLGNTLVTHQTGAAGKCVQKVFIAPSVEIQKEYYLALLLDRKSGTPMIIASEEGGVDIEEVAATTPEKIIQYPLDPLLGLEPYQARNVAQLLHFSGKELLQASKLMLALYNLFEECNATMVEINPLILSSTGEIMALDAKLSFDENAFFAHPEISSLRDPQEEDPREIEATQHGLNYIGLEGNIACLVNGAGLAMATMDIIKHYGGEPANFLDVGGGASEEQVREAFSILSSDPQVKAILVNIFGGIMKCDIIAQGIITAIKKVGLKLPLIIRLEGTRVAEGKKLLEESGLPLLTADNLADAAQKAVQAAT